MGKPPFTLLNIHDHFPNTSIQAVAYSPCIHAQGHFSYNAAKGSTVHLSKLMSYEFKKAGIRVNSIAPGYFPPGMTTKESDENQKEFTAAGEDQGKRSCSCTTVRV